MSDVPRFDLRSKRKTQKKQKVDIFDEDDKESSIQVDGESDSLASADTSSNHSYEDYSKAYKDLTLETPIDQPIGDDDQVDSVSTILESKADNSWYDKTVEAEERVQKPKRITKQKVQQTDEDTSDLKLQLAQLSLRIQKMESETRAKTIDSAYHTIITQAENLTTPQKKSLIAAIIATMR
uniref:NSP5 n=1 Tax=Porcine rotavirus H TaxID=1420855 RepID=A0A5H2PK31_9REOV|nr:NSP5 [Porcine rotavirus H]